MISLICPHCKTELDAEERLAGKVVSCPACGKSVIVPGRVTKVIPVRPSVKSPKKSTPSSSAADETKSGGIADTEAQWRKLFFSKKVVFALPVAILAAAPFALLGAAVGMRLNAGIAHIGKSAAVALFGKKDR